MLEEDIYYIYFLDCYILHIKHGITKYLLSDPLSVWVQMGEIWQYNNLNRNCELVFMTKS